MKTNDLELLEEDKRINKQLIEEYPFLLPRNRFSDKADDDYDYSYTELDIEVPYGWKEMCKNLCAELKELLLKAEEITGKGYFSKYRIVQIKEKFGTLRWYDNGFPKCVSDEYYKLIGRYELLSEKTCVHCGKPAKMCYTSWISPICKKCWDDNQQRLFSQGIIKEKINYKDVTDK